MLFTDFNGIEDFDKKVRYFKILGTFPKGRLWN